MRILMKGDHPQSHLIGEHVGSCPPHWVGIYICDKCYCVFEVQENDAPKVYQGNVAEDATCSCPNSNYCRNTLKLGPSYRLNALLASMVIMPCQN